MRIHISTDDGEELDFGGNMLIFSTENGCTILGHGSYGDIMDLLANAVLSSYKVGTNLMKSYIEEDKDPDAYIPTLNEFLKELNLTSRCIDQIEKVNELGGNNEIILNFISNGENCQINLKEYLKQEIEAKFNDLLDGKDDKK